MKNILCAMLVIASLSVSAQNKGQFNKFNPAIGMSTMMLMQDSQVDAQGDGFSLQGVELQFSSDVDAFMRAQIVLGIHKEGHHEHDEHEDGDEHEEEENGFKLHPEEAFIETIAIDGFTIKAGKFLSSFGKYNGIHLHAQPFIERSLVQKEFFGHDGFSSNGISAAFLIPLTSWFSEFTIEALAPENEALFEESHHATVYIAKLKQLWDLSDEATIEWGISSLSYKRPSYNDHDEEVTNVWGSDLTFKYRELSNKYTTFVWSTEFIEKDVEVSEHKSHNLGVTSFIKYKSDIHWFWQAQYERLGLNRSSEQDHAYSSSALVGYDLSEFSALRLQYDITKVNQEETEKRLSLQLNFTMGAHPSHKY